MDEKGLGSVAHPGPLSLCVHEDPERHVQVRARIYVDVTITVTVDHARDRGVLADAGDQRMSSAWDQAVDDTVELHEGDGGLAARVLDEQHCVGWEAGLVQRLPQAQDDRTVRLDRRGRSPEHHRIAGLDTQAGGVGCDVGPVLVDDAHDAERDPHPLHA